MFGLFIFNNSILIILFFWYSKKLFIFSEQKKYKILILSMMIVIKSLSNLYNSFELNLLLTVLIYFCISLIFFKGSITKTMLFIGFFIITSFVSEMTTYVILTPLLTQYGIQSDSIFFTIIGNALSLIVLIIIVYIIARLNDIKDMVDSKAIWYIITLPIISIIIIYTIITSDLLEINPKLCILISFEIVVFNIIICVGFADVIKSKNIQIEHEKLKSQELHHLLLEEKLDNSKRFIHDLKKHVNILNGYVSNCEFEKLEIYLKELSSEIKKDENFVITGNQIIDLSLNANKDILTKFSIDVKHYIKIKNLLPVSEFDFNIVFSNILDNAIESCMRTKGHFIKIKLKREKGLIILKIINPCFEVKKGYKTLKIDNEYHGYGIKNIKRIVQKYDGSASFEFDEKNQIFVSTVIFNKLS